MKKYTFLFLVLSLIALLALPVYASKSAKGNQPASVRPQLNQLVEVEVQQRLAQPEYPMTVPNRSMEKAGKAGLSGLYSIGQLAPGGYVANYLTLAAAVADLQAVGVAGAVTFEFTDATYADTGVVIGGYPGQNDYSVTFQPVTGVTPTITFTTAANAYPGLSGGLTTNDYGIKFIGAANVTIQGTTTPWYFGFTTRPLTMVADTTAMIGTWYLRKNIIAFGLNNNNILVKDINAIGWRKWTGTLGGYGVIYGVNGTGTGNNKYMTFQNILLKRGNYGFNFGPPNGFFDTSITIQGCQIGTDRYEPLQYGIGASNQRNMYVYDNDITGIYVQGIAPVTGSPRGINMAWGGMFGTRIWGNSIHGVQADVINGVCYGIQIHSNGGGGSQASDDWRLFNNFVYDINYMGVRTGGNYQTSEGMYMYDYGPAPQIIGNVRFYNNTFHLFGTQTPAAAGGWTGCVVDVDLTGDYYRFANNIFANGRVSSGGGQAFFEAFENNPPWLIDNNVYYGYNGNTACASGDLAALQAWTLQDYYSLEGNPGFIGDYNPHIDQTTVGFVSIANALAFPYAQIADDIDKEARDLATPDAGADEFTPTPWPIDAKPMAIYLPLPGGYPLGGIPKTGFTPSVKVRNNGATDATIKVRMIIEGEYNEVTEQFVTSLQNADINFATPWTPGSIGEKDVLVITEVYADNDMVNDTLRSTTNVLKMVGTYPYCTTFEDGEEAYFLANGFTLGTPAKTNINATYSGANAFVVDPLNANYVDNDIAFLYTPYFNFTGMTNPKINFQHVFAIEATWDEGVVEYTDDYGANWHLLGTYAENPSWYNDNTLANLILGVPGFSGNNTSFPSYDLAYLYAGDASNKVVQFRFHFAADGATTDEGWAIDNFCVNAAATIAGTVYNDADNNGDKGGTEPGLAGKKVYYGAEYVTTDGDGNYLIPGLTPGTYSITTEAITGTRTEPVTYPYSVTVADDDAVTGKDFGYYNPGVISGVVYYDENHNGTKDGGEVGMDGITVKIDGPANYTVVTAGGGLYSKQVNVVGTYDVTQDLTSLPSGYIQYTPASNGGYNVVVAYGGTYANNDFGNAASNSAKEFRTAMYADWAAALDIKSKLGVPNKKKNSQCEIEFVVTAAFDCEQVIIKKFGGKFTGTVEVGTDPAIPLVDAVDYTIATPVAVGTEIHVTGHLTNKAKSTYGVEIHWDGVTAPLWKQKLKYSTDYIVNQGRLPMPNWHNVTEALNVGGYFGKTSPLWVGIQQGGTNPSAVYHVDYKKVIESMVIAKSSSYHTGDPVCMSVFTKAQKSYKPTVSPSNKFFAELLTLKLNMMASTAGYFPIGLKELTFDDPNNLGNPFNGLKVEAIALKAESLITCLTLESGATIEDAYETIRMIDSAFNHSSIDTVAWGTLAWPGIEIAGVRPLSDVEYLYADPSYNPQKGVPAGPVVASPVEYALEQNYPNPFNPSTTIEFTLLQPGNVTLKVYNMLGQEVASLLDNVYYDEGYNDVDFDASQLSSGIYFYRLTVQNVDDEGMGSGQAFTQIKKMMLVK